MKFRQPQPSRPAPLAVRIVRGVLVVVSVVSALALLASSYGGMFDPSRFPMAGMASMAMPLSLGAAVACLVVDLLWCRRAALLLVGAFIVSLPSVLDFCPLHIVRPKLDEAEKERSFTLLTYNIYVFRDITGQYPDSVNPGLQYVINSGADIVCLQEAYAPPSYRERHITPGQIDTLHRRYPYVLLNGTGAAIFSRYPVKAIPTGYQRRRDDKTNADIAAYRVNVDGRDINLFNVHLQSIGLTDSDKKRYDSVATLRHASDMEAVGSMIVEKLTDAYKRRVKQTRMLMSMLSRYGGENVIVCGDFNDTPGCYSLRMLSDAGLKQVYPAVGLGPMVTYNSAHLYFRIDHVLYRGDFRPVAMKRGRLRSSDHYPLITTFVWDE